MRGIKNVLNSQDSYSSKSYESNPPTNSSNLQNSVGAKLLKQMGWNAGEGLGKTNQGKRMFNIILFLKIMIYNQLTNKKEDTEL